MKVEFSRPIFENPLISNFMKIHPVGAELFHEDGQKHRRTDRYDEANSRFLQVNDRAEKVVNPSVYITINNHVDFIVARLVMNW